MTVLWLEGRHCLPFAEKPVRTLSDRLQRPAGLIERVYDLAHPEQRREGQPHDAPAWRAAKHEGTVADSFLQAFNVKYFP